MKYKIWNKTDDIFTPGKDPETGKSRWTAQEYIESFAPWAGIPGVRIIIGGGVINGAVFLEYDATVEFYKKLGVAITDDMTPDEVLAAIEAFDNTPPTADVPPDERIAAALEFQNLLSM